MIIQGNSSGFPIWNILRLVPHHPGGGGHLSLIHILADYIVDLGPEGGDKGGEVVATGTPEEIAACEKSYTGAYLKKILKR